MREASWMSSRILLLSEVSAAAVIGGAERVLREQALGLCRAGHEVGIIARAPSGDSRPQVDIGSILERRYHPSRRGEAAFVLSSWIRALRTFGQACGGERVDAGVVHQSLAGLGPLLHRRRAASGWVYMCLSLAHEEYVTRRSSPATGADRIRCALNASVRRCVERAVMRRCGRVVVLSEFMRDRVFAVHAIPRESVRLIPGAADLTHFRPATDRAEVREGLKLPVHKVILFSVRNLVPRMGLDTLIHAMAGLGEDGKHVELFIGGEGTLRSALQRQISELGLTAQVHLLGFIPEEHLPKFYQAADIVIMPTHQLEGFGLVTVEALACGTPVLGTPVGAIPEILGPIDPALLTESVEKGALTEGIRRLVRRFRDRPDDQRHLAQTCRAFVEQHYTWEQHVRGLEAILEDAASGSA